VKGKISKYMSSRGYGFINIADSEKDIFFHMSNFPPRELPLQNQLVEFEVKETPKGREAINIKIVVDEAEEEKIQEVVEESTPEVVEEKPVKKEAPVVSTTHSIDELSGIGPKYKELLEKTGITSCEDVSRYTPENLLAKLLEVNEKEQITKRPPNQAKVTEWITKASEVVA
jgi:cold shock CspA family protein